MKYDEGSGPSFVHHLYYDSASGQCNPFIYKGEGGNANRFKSDKDCMRNCSARAEEVYPMEGKVEMKTFKVIFKSQSHISKMYIKV